MLKASVQFLAKRYLERSIAKDAGEKREGYKIFLSALCETLRTSKDN